MFGSGCAHKVFFCRSVLQDGVTQKPSVAAVVVRRVVVVTGLAEVVAAVVVVTGLAEVVAAVVAAEVALQTFS